MLAEESWVEAFDAWPLLAVIYASGDDRGTDLATIQLLLRLIHPDAGLERDLPAALGRLHAASLVCERDGKLYPADAIAGFFHARRHRRSVQEDYRGLVQLVGALKVS